MHHSKKTTNRSSVSSVAKHKEINENTLYIAEYTPVVVYHAQFYNQHFLICTNTIKIYNIVEMTLESQIKVKTHWASFVPFSDYICFTDGEKDQKKYLVFWDVKKEEVQAKLTVNFSIEEIRCSRGAITLTSQQHLYTIHFPSLKPIYEGFAGNGIRVIFDASREGLTLAHNTEKKGEVMVLNFTNIETNKLLNELQSQSKAKDFSKIFKEKSIVMGKTGKDVEKEQEIQKELGIKAHDQNIVLVRLSPNGYRIVSASVKGTIIRMHSCLKGELISEFRVAYHLSRIIDLQFIPEGNQIVCLNDQNEVCLFHTRMSDLQLLSESSRRGYEIYQQKNPTSFFSFLGFLNQNLYNEYPFAYFEVDVNKDDIKDLKQKLESEREKEKIKIAQIKAVIESHHEDSDSEKEDNQKEKEHVNLSGKKEQDENHSVSIAIEEMPQAQEQKKVPRPEFPTLGIFKKHSLVSQNNFKSLKVPSLHSAKNKATGSSSSAGKNSKRNAELKHFGEKEKKMFFKGIVSFGSDTNVKVFQGKYFFHLKFDPFNGGRMVEKESINMLKHQLFSDL